MGGRSYGWIPCYLLSQEAVANSTTVHFVHEVCRCRVYQLPPVKGSIYPPHSTCRGVGDLHAVPGSLISGLKAPHVAPKSRVSDPDLRYEGECIGVFPRSKNVCSRAFFEIWSFRNHGSSESVYRMVIWGPKVHLLEVTGGVMLDTHGLIWSMLHAFGAHLNFEGASTGTDLRSVGTPFLY